MKSYSKAAKRAGRKPTDVEAFVKAGGQIRHQRDKGVRPERKQPRHPKITPEIIDAHTWYALRITSQKEFAAQTILKERGLLTYVPVRKEWRHRNKFDRAKQKKVLKTYPQAYGYVLTGFTSLQMAPGNIPYWLRLFSIPIIRGVVGIELEHKPLELPHDEMKRMVQRFPNGMQRPDHEAYMRTHKEFTVGDTVTMPGGPFDGHLLKVIDIKDVKAKFIVELFGAEHEIWADTFDLEAA